MKFATKVSVVLVGLCFIFENGISNRNSDIFDVKLRYFLESLSDDYSTSIRQPLELLKFPNFDLKKSTVFYIHGYRENITWDSIQFVLEAYLKRMDHNTVLVDWTAVNGGSYFFNAAPNAIKVGFALAKALNNLTASHMDPSLIHIVGHSLGAQSAGFAGKSTVQKIGRITVLDAANPGFYGLGMHVNSTDADFVDAIHTDSGIYGAQFPTAQVDFWPNGGIRLQPGCKPFPPLYPYPLSPEDLCSHWRSWMFWAESLTNEAAFPSRKCKVSYLTLSDRMHYIDTHIVYMGYPAYKGLKGDYCLKTRGKSPFGYGNDQYNVIIDN